MRVNQRRIVISLGSSPDGQRPKGILARVFGFAVGAVVLVGAFVFSLAVFAVLLGVGVIAAGYLWWQTRALREQLRESVEAARRDASTAEGEALHPAATTIEGEFTREGRHETEAGR